MHWLVEVIDRLSRRPCCGYRADGPAAVEPTALAAMALAAHGRTSAAHEALEWLASIQSDDGSLGIIEARPSPSWPTSWAILAWSVDARRQDSATHGATPDASAAAPKSTDWKPRIRRAADWLLKTKGLPSPRSPLIGHDTTIEAWSWVEGTHSWVEPTAIGLMAMKACGNADQPRSRDAVRMLCDRAVASGGWNYGNRMVLGAELEAHVQPTGLALAALAGEASASSVVAPAINYLRSALSANVASASLSYALIGLAAHGQSPAQSQRWLEIAASRTLEQGAPPYQLALLSLAAGRGLGIRD